jgi:metallo-beta-lactamase family protein
MTEAPTIAFQGAARTVTGSRHLIRCGDRRVLFDCGLYQGRRDEAEHVNRHFDFPPGDLDAVVLSHAHLDHTGNLPTLVAQGYRGSIHATPATSELCAVLLPDSAALMERDVEHVNRHRRHGAPDRRPLYSPADVDQTLERLVSHAYHDTWPLFENIKVTYLDAGHILGSALTLIDLELVGKRVRLLMSGDVGRAGRPILRDPEAASGVDVLVMESTYGDREHPPASDTVRQLAEAVERTLARGGRVLIPAFAVGRTQELVATLHDLMQRRVVRETPIFVDSPMAWRATQAFRHHPECFDDATRRAFEDEDGAPFGFDRLRYLVTADQSRALNERRAPCIVIAASGMCEGGRILHHLQHGLGEPRNTVLFVGFQAEGTLGRRLRDGASPVNIFGEPVERRAEVVALDGFSAHADQRELLAWVARLDPAPRSIYLVHGEIGPAETLAARLRQSLPSQVHVPRRGEEFPLWN